MQINKNILVIVLMISAVVIRFINVLPNFSPVVGLTLFGAAFLSRKSIAFLLPLFFVYISDFVINNTFARGFYPEVEGVVWFSEYMIWGLIAYSFIAMIGIVAFKSKVKVSNALFVTLLSSVVFFLVTNLGSWLDPKMFYPNNFSGLILSYEAALPFFRTSLISDLAFSTALFGSYYIIQNYFVVKGDRLTA